MRVNTKQAVKLFFQNPSLEQVFKEAIANSLDANATDIKVNVFIDSFEKQETLRIKIVDNGEGFTEERYEKFCELLKVEEETHKGVGRLVYLSYFDTIEISSYYNGNHRTFTFNDGFDKEKTDMKLLVDAEKKQETTLVFKNCSLQRLSSNSVITPEYLKRQILLEFYPRLYLLKKKGKDIKIVFKIDIPHKNKKHYVGSYEKEITSSDIPDMQTTPINADVVKMYESTQLDYSVTKMDPYSETFLMTALCVDNRAQVLDDIISPENLPKSGYSIVFIMRSSFFDGKVDAARQTLTLKEADLKTIKVLFREKVAEIIEREISSIKEQNQKTRESLNKTYPHLLGYFDKNEVGIIERSKSIEEAQKRFMRDQKEILEAQSLDDTRYDKALDVSSRTLAQYILYREKIIQKIEMITKDNPESDIHNIILPQRNTYSGGDIDCIYNNNLWLLDNKYMTYTTAMSDKTMKQVIEEITQASADTDNDRPDIVIMFSNDPCTSKGKSVDVVIIELKKRGIKLAKAEEAISQLKQRAIKLLKYYPNKIQRMWFYAIVEFNDDFELSLINEEYTPLFSKDSLYYKENSLQISLDDPTKYPIGTYVLSIDAFIKDAKANNEVFLNILKDGFNHETK
ncbi:MAG: ATP-binding protein [Bacteroidales bacterium]|nr:ATP-binding protein [Bacteroidales bacterium]